MRKILPALSVIMIVGVSVGCSKDDKNGGNGPPADPPTNVGAKTVVMHVPGMS